jgi:hypothetical protein
MSYTQFVSTATLTLSEDFNLESYLDAISERCVKEENFIFENYGEFDGKVDVDFADYVRKSGGNILIECDTEESNGNSEIWDWLIDQFLPVMTSEFVEIKSATIDSRSGVDIGFSLYGRDGKCVDLSDIVKVYKNAVTL